MNSTEVVGNIVTGECDDILNDIVQAVKDRRNAINSNKIRSISVGDVVVFNKSVRPRYLEGKTAVVTKVNRKTVDVDCPNDPDYRGFCGAKSVRCPISIVTKEND